MDPLNISTGLLQAEVLLAVFLFFNDVYSSRSQNYSVIEMYSQDHGTQQIQTGGSRVVSQVWLLYTASGIVVLNPLDTLPLL